MSIVVCPLSYLEEVTAARRPTHVITLLDPDHAIPTPGGVAPERHLRLGMHDINDPADGLDAPDEAMVSEILRFGEGWDPAETIVIHCWAGISRSTATAFILACAKNPQAGEREIAEELRRQSRFAMPNRRLVAFADILLGREGRMSDAVAAMGSPVYAGESEPFELKSQW